MNTIRFTDNKGIRKVVIDLTPREVAEHLTGDQQFVYYWRKNWDPRLAAIRSLYIRPVSDKAIVTPALTEDQWYAINAELCHIIR
jgi:hypothetical protein